MPAKTKSQLIAELAALQQRVAQLEIEQQNREADLARWLVAERERWALAEALHQTGASIGSTLRGEEVLDRILEEMSRVVACDAACLLLIEGELARIYRWRGYIRSRRATAKDIVSAAFKIESIPVLRAVQETRRPLVVSRPANNEAWVRKFGTTWVKSYACAPIRSRGRVIGFLVIDSEVPGFLEPDDAEPLQAFADQAARALENVGYYDRTRDEIVTRLRTFKKERNFISTLLDTANALVIALDQAGRIVHFNRACEQTSGYTFAEVKNHYLWELLPEETAALAENYFMEHLSSPDSRQSNSISSKYESYLITKTGQQRMIAWSNAVLLDRTGAVEYIITTGVDITEQKQVEETLRQSEQRLDLALMGADLGWWDLNVQTGEDITNARMSEMLGYTLDEIESHLDWWDKQTHPEDMPRVLAAWEAHVSGVTSFYECEYRLRTKSGNWKWVLDRGKVVQRDEFGQPLRWCGTHLDITERKQADEALRAQNEQLQARNQELDAFARTVAHDLRNPLGSLTGIAEVLHEDYTRIPSEKLREYLESIARSGRRASRIVEALLLLAGVRQQTINLQPLDMSSIVDEALQRLASMVADYQAKIITPTVWPAAIGFAPWIEEVWVNYLSNGLKYGGQPPHLELGATRQEDGMIRFWVKDNGPGLIPESQAKLFTEFTQLEPDRVDGYGLGLSIVRRIVEKLGGQVGVESDGVPGRGSIFSFTLPQAGSNPT
jgi:PAS domain S-box-containing protein